MTNGAREWREFTNADWTRFRGAAWAIDLYGARGVRASIPYAYDPLIRRCLELIPGDALAVRQLVADLLGDQPGRVQTRRFRVELDTLVMQLGLLARAVQVG